MSTKVLFPGVLPGLKSTMQIRMYQPSDATALAELYVRSVLHFGPRAYTQDQVSAWATTCSAEIMASRCMDGRLILVALDDLGRHLGFGDLEEDGHLDFLYSAPEAEGLRVGSALYSALEAHARNRGIARIYVEASELAKPFLEKLGFALLGRNDLKLENVGIHNFRMEKWLQSAFHLAADSSKRQSE